jgi:Mg-chelatase subunit ChlD
MQVFRRLLFILTLFTGLCVNEVNAKQKTFQREYTYNASEADSRISARAIALGQVKQLLLEELGSYIQSELWTTTTEENDQFKTMSSAKIKSITAGIAATRIVEERWNGEEFYLKADITVDEDFLKKRLKEIAANTAEMDRLAALQQKTDSAFAEIERLRQLLESISDEKEKERLQEKYEALAANYNWRESPEATPRMEVVFVLDATGSMGSMIANAKDKIWAIATTMAQSEPAPELSIGVIAYRDRTDSYVTKQLPLTNSIDELYTQLLEIQAAGGGDMPESVNQGLSEAVFDYQWDTNPTTLRSIYLIGDCPPHLDYHDDIHYRESCAEARKKDILINTIQCGVNSSTTPIWKEIAQLGGGVYLSLDQSGNNFAISTPYDTELARKAKELDGTRLYYGQNAIDESNRKKMVAEAIYEKSNDEEEARRGIYNATTSSGRKSFLGEGELIQAYADKRVDAGQLTESELPEELKNRTPEERKKYLDTKLEERQKIEAEIKALNAKREAYIQEQLEARKSEAKNSFNNQLHNVFREQAKRKQYSAPKHARF